MRSYITFGNPPLHILTSESSQACQGQGINWTVQVGVSLAFGRFYQVRVDILCWLKGYVGAWIDMSIVSLMSSSREGSTNAFSRLRRDRGMKNETDFFRVTLNDQTSKARGVEATNYRVLTTFGERDFSLPYSLFELRLQSSRYEGQSQ